jgi:hypothetical protein
VQLDLPADYVVGATGILQTESEKSWLEEISKNTRAHLRKELNREKVHPAREGRKTISYRQDSIHDFAWFADKEFLLLKGNVELPHSGRQVQTQAFFTPENRKKWSRAPEYLKDATYYYSLWNKDYPYACVSAVDGTISAGGGMEYPMITVIGNSSSDLLLEEVIMHEVGHNWFYGILGSNERANPWMDEGINTANEIRYMRTKYPRSKLFDLPFFGLNQYHHTYTHFLMYMYMERLGLDQALSDGSQDQSQANYGAMVYSKTGLFFEYLRAFMGDSAYDGMMREYNEKWGFRHPGPEDLQELIEYHLQGSQSDWFTKEVWHSSAGLDYSMERIQATENGYRLELKNKGGISGPVHVELRNDDQTIQSLWIEGFTGRKEIFINSPKAELVLIDPYLCMPENDRSNNRIRTGGVLKKVEPIQFQLLGGLEDGSKTQVFWSPAIRWNNYDKLMLGISLYNTHLPVRPFQYKITPVYAFGSRQISGNGQIAYTLFTDEHWIRALRFGLYGQSYQYAPGLNYTRLSPTINIDFRKAYPRSPHRHSLRLRNVYVDRELPSYGEDGVLVLLNPSRYGVLDIRYRWENTEYLRPFTLSVDQQISTDFGRLSAELEYRIMLPNKNRLSMRFFAGVFLWNEYPAGNSFYNFGMSGTQDYLFDYYFLGRSDTTGIWSQQFFITEGGFKARTSSFSNQFILSGNLRLPLWKFIGLYADLGYSGASNELLTNNSRWYYGSGIEIRFIEDFFEIYFPLVDQSGWMSNGNYAEQIRFVLDLDLDNILAKATRGWY